MKKLFRSFVILFICFIISGCIGIQAQAYSSISYSIKSATTYSDIIEWRYKVEDGQLYKRQYNYTQSKWIGNWILVS